LDNLYLMNKDV